MGESVGDSVGVLDLGESVGDFVRILDGTSVGCEVGKLLVAVISLFSNCFASPLVATS